MKVSIPRLRRVRFKDGRTLEVFRKPIPPQEIQANLRMTVNRCLESEVGDGMAGFAFVAWAKTGEVFVNYENGDGSLVSGGAVPQYVKDILLAELAARWSRD